MAAAAVKLQDDPLYKAGVADGLQPPAPAWASAPIADAAAHSAKEPAWTSAPIATPEAHRAIGAPEAFAHGAVDAATIGAGDEIAQGAMDIGQIPDRMGRAGAEIVHNLFDPAHQISVPQPARSNIGQEMRDDLAASEQQHPVSTLAGNMVGSLAPVSRVAKAIEGAKLVAGPVGRVLSAALAGGGSAGVYGFNSTDGDLGARAQGAAEAVLAGLAGGAAFGAGAQVLNPLFGAAGRAVTGAGRKLFPELLGMERPALSGGAAATGDNGGMAGKYPTGEEPIPDKDKEQVIQQLAKFAARKNLTPEDLDTQLDAAQAQPVGKVSAELFGRSGIRPLKTLAEMPGKTADRLEPMMEERTQGQLSRFNTYLDQALPDLPSTRAARANLDEAFGVNSLKQWQPTLNGVAPDPDVLNSKIRPLIDQEPMMQPVLQKAKAVGDQLGRQALRNGGQPEPIDIVKGDDGKFSLGQNPNALTLHLVKLGWDPVVQAAQVPEHAGGIGSFSYPTAVGIKSDLVSGLKQAIPGYAAASEKFGDLAGAQKAMTAARNLFSPTTRPDELAEYVQNMTPFQRQYFTSQAKDEIRTLFAKGADADGIKNLGKTLSSPYRQQVVRAALGDGPSQALFDAAGVERPAYKAAREMTPGTGSPTFGLAATSADNLVTALSTHPSGWLSKGAGALVHRITAPKLEQARDQLGAALSVPLDSGLKNYSYEDVQRLRMLVRRALQRKQGFTAASVGEGVDAGIGGSRNKDKQ